MAQTIQTYKKWLELLADCNSKLLPIQCPPSPSPAPTTMVIAPTTSKAVLALANIPNYKMPISWDGEWRVHNWHPNLSPRNQKFCTTTTRKVKQPLPDCQWMMVVKHPTYYTPKASHNHIQEMEPTLTDWQAYIKNLPEDIEWVFTHSNIIEMGPWLAEMLTNKGITAISDGSFKDKQGTAAWVCYTKSVPKQALMQGAITTPGYPNVQGSYWSKLAGIYGIVTTILMICKFHKIMRGNILVICDGESTLKWCFKQQTCNPAEKHFNIIHGIWTIMQETPLTWQCKHIRGHQDKAKLEKSHKACWSTAMDTAAKNHWEKSKTTQTQQF